MVDAVDAGPEDPRHQREFQLAQNAFQLALTECASAYASAFDAQDEAAEARAWADELHARSVALAEEGYADEEVGISAAREAEDAERRAVTEDEELEQEHELCIRVYGATTAIAYR